MIIIILYIISALYTIMWKALLMRIQTRTQLNKVKVVNSSSAAYMIIGHHRTYGEAAQVSLKDILV